MADGIDKSKEAIAKVLVSQNVLSQAQIDLAYMDMEVNDLSFEDVLYMRGWISEEKLYELVPFLKPGYKPPAKEAAPKTPVEKKVKAQAKPAVEEPPLVIALGAPKQELEEVPIIALGSPKEEEPTEVSEVAVQEEILPIALESPKEEEEKTETEPTANQLKSTEEEKEQEAQDETPAIALESAKINESESATTVSDLFREETNDTPPIAADIENAAAVKGADIFEQKATKFAFPKDAVDELFTIAKESASIEPVSAASPQSSDIASGEKAKISSTPVSEEKPRDEKPKEQSTKAEAPKGIVPGSSPGAGENKNTNDTAGSGASKPKPADIPGEPPLRSAEAPAVIHSPIEKSKEQSLKAYKEVLRKILTIEKK